MSQPAVTLDEYSALKEGIEQYRSLAPRNDAKLLVVVRTFMEIPMEDRKMLLEKIVSEGEQRMSYEPHWTKTYMQIMLGDALLELNEDPRDFFPEGWRLCDEPDEVMRADLIRVRKNSPDYVKAVIVGMVLSILFYCYRWWSK